MDKREAYKRAHAYLTRLRGLKNDVRMPECIMALSNEEGFLHFGEVLSYAVASAQMANFCYSRAGLMRLAEEYGWTHFETQIAEETLRLNDCWDCWMDDWEDDFWEAA